MEERQSRLSSMVWRRLRPYFCVRLILLNSMFSNFCHVLNSGRTFISFIPKTGRTHQLRVHSAHPLGLNAPIVGDELYGRKADRLYLHAEYLGFIHPVSGVYMEIEKESGFDDLL